MTEEKEVAENTQPAKKKILSVPFLLLGVLLLACLCPVGDVDGDGSMDVAGKWVMLKVMTSQENSKVGGPVKPDKIDNSAVPPMSGQ